MKKLFNKLGTAFLSLAVLLLATACPGNPKPETKITYPEFSPIGGFYKSAQTVSMSCEGSTAIYYTTDCSLPTEESTKYTEPFEVNEQCVVRAMAVKADGSKNYAMTAFDFDLDRTTDYTGTALESPDWQNQVIYFILTDRFFNGDTTNDKTEGLKDQKDKDYDESVILAGQPASGYNGGDLKGIEEKLDYIQGLGATAIWITPPIKNQVAEGNYHGYHGYWASDFTKVDEHQGTLKQYQSLVDAAHKRGIAVIQDIVINHTGDYQKISDNVSITPEMLKNKATSDFVLNADSVPYNHPEQLPWAFNNINDLTPDEMENNPFYHFNSSITDFTDKSQRYTWQSSNLDDIATENPVVRNLMRGYFRYWIDKAGIDGYRIDTVYYVEEDFFEDFINGTEEDNKGIRPYAATLGKEDFINFGEAWSTDESIVSGYTRGSKGEQRMDSILYFPLRFAITDTISGGGSTNAITKVLENRYKTSGNIQYQNPDRLVTFIDNHDTERFGKTMNGNPELIKAAYGIIFTVPGIPQIYYGTEQGFNGECRAGMFAGSFKEEGTTQASDMFDTSNSWYKYFQDLTAMRKDNAVFTSNRIDVIADTDQGAGLFAYVIQQTDKEGNAVTGEKNKAVFIMNTASSAKVLSGNSDFLTAGDKFELLEKVSACPEGSALVNSIIANSSKSLNLVVPGHSCGIYLISDTDAAIPGAGNTITVDSIPTEKCSSKTVTVKGTANKTGTVKIVLAGDYSQAVEVSVEANKQFTAEINTKKLSSGTISVQFILIADGAEVYSEVKSFEFEVPYLLNSSITDPANDDNGVGIAKGKVQLPTHKSFKKQLDIIGVDTYRAGNDIRLGIKMGSLSKTWNPTSNYFDHVIFHVFISDGDDETGYDKHPGYSYTLPSTFGKWDYVFQCNGWGQAFYTSKDAGPELSTPGTATSPTPSNTPAVNWDGIDEDGDGQAELDWSGYTAPENWADHAGVIWITIPSAALGYPEDITGYKLYINTYDFDMGAPRGMAQGDPEEYKFGGPGYLSPSVVPKVLDETDSIITIQ